MKHYLYIIFLLHSSLAFAQVDADGLWRVPKGVQMKIDQCYTYCLDREQIQNDSITDFLQMINRKIEFRKAYHSKVTEQIIKKVGVKKAKKTPFPTPKQLSAIKYDTIIETYLMRLGGHEQQAVDYETIVWSNSSALCQLPQSKDCRTVCLYASPNKFGFKEVLIPTKSSLPIGLKRGINLKDDEEWVIAPTYGSLTTEQVLVANDLSSVILPVTMDVSDKLKSLKSVIANAYTDWLQIQCFEVTDRKVTIPYLSYALHKKGFAKRRFTNELDAQFIKDLLHFQEKKGLKKGVINQATLDSLTISDAERPYNDWDVRKMLEDE